MMTEGTNTHAAAIDLLIACADRHGQLDEYRAGHYDWRYGGACGIGCAVRDLVQAGVLPHDTCPGNHKALAEATGIPEWALWMEDAIFENLPDDQRSAWPATFLRAARNVHDWDRARARFLISVLMLARHCGMANIVQPIIDLWQRVLAGEPAESLVDEFKAARNAAYAEASLRPWSATELWLMKASSPPWGQREVWLANELAPSTLGATFALIQASQAAVWAAGASWEAIRDNLLAAMESETTGDREAGPTDALSTPSDQRP